MKTAFYICKELLMNIILLKTFFFLNINYRLISSKSTFHTFIITQFLQRKYNLYFLNIADFKKILTPGRILLCLKKL